jgi:hypothetical protein
MNPKPRRKRHRHRRAVSMLGKPAKKIYRTADRMQTRQQWHRDNNL